MDPGWDRRSVRKAVRFHVRFGHRLGGNDHLPVALVGDRVRWLKDESVWEVTSVDGGEVSARVVLQGRCSQLGDDANVTAEEWAAMLASGALCQARPLHGEQWFGPDGQVYTVVSSHVDDPIERFAFDATGGWAVF